MAGLIVATRQRRGITVQKIYLPSPIMAYWRRQPRWASPNGLSPTLNLMGVNSNISCVPSLPQINGTLYRYPTQSNYTRIYDPFAMPTEAPTTITTSETAPSSSLGKRSRKGIELTTMVSRRLTTRTARITDQAHRRGQGIAQLVSRERSP
jgi:hypothetical protein